MMKSVAGIDEPKKEFTALSTNFLSLLYVTNDAKILCINYSVYI